MKRLKYIVVAGFLLFPALMFNSCKDFLNPEQETKITDDKLFDDWYEYRSIAMGMYGIQKDLLEQLIILGELRGDLLNVTENADADMVEIYNFNVSKNNKYASPTNFFRLIASTNNFIRALQKYHPEVLDKTKPISNFDRLYGEALCMRAWAYFNAARIYGKVPFIHESLTTMEEVNEYVNSKDKYIDKVDITYGIDGFKNDTSYNKTYELDKKLYSVDLVIDYFTNDLINNVKAVGVNHYIDNNDATWEVTIWNPHAMNALLGIMFLTDGDLAQSVKYFEKITNFSSENYRYQLDQSFSYNNWKNMFNNIDLREHIFSMWFNKSYFQQHDLQEFFEPRQPHKYMLKPTRSAILNWEGTWRGFSLITGSTPKLTRIGVKGTPGDFFRGYGVSYSYLRNGIPLTQMDVFSMLWLKSEGDFRTAGVLMEDVDTVVWKYSWNKGVYDMDSHFPLYRAGGVQLWLAEAYVYWAFVQNGILRTFTLNAQNMVNNGSNYDVNSTRKQMGVRGRVGLGGAMEGISATNINYVHDPISNEVKGYLDLTGDFIGKQKLLEDKILDERARELAYEGERFYDLMRIAKRRNDPSYLAKRVSEKYPADKRKQIYNLLLKEENWYINYFK